MNIRKKINNNLINALGFRSNRKLIVIESDDWGSIRMASKDAYHSLLAKAYPVDNSQFNRFDSLECNSDVENLMNVLDSVKDKNLNPAKITINNVVGNPDFDRIKNSDYTEYFYEPFTETLKRYPKHDKVFDLLQEGTNRNLFKPQFHGREHLNVKRWLKALNSGSQPLLDAFHNKMYSLHFDNNTNYKNEYLDALDFDSIEQMKDQQIILKEGIELFNKIWGFNSLSFIANCYIWHHEHEKVLSEHGVKFIQGLVNQFVPIPENGNNYKRVFHYMGQKNKNNQRYLIRNVFFEPYQKQTYDWVDECMKRIEIAFRWNKPAIISSHRINFIGFIDPDFRDKNLSLFSKLLNSIVKKWSDVEFVSSDELGKIIEN